MSQDFLTYNQKVMKEVCGGVDITNVRPITKVKQDNCVFSDEEAILIIGGKRYDVVCEIHDVNEHDAYEMYLLGTPGRVCVNPIFEDEEITEIVEG